MGRYGVEYPRKHLINFKVNDHELRMLELMEQAFANRSEMIRTILFEYALAIDPEEVRELVDRNTLERLKQRVKEG